MADMAALSACVREFAERMEALGAGALLVSYSVDTGADYTGHSTGFGEGPILMLTLDGMLGQAQRHDAIAVLGVARKYAQPADEIDWGHQLDVLDAAMAERDALIAKAASDKPT